MLDTLRKSISAAANIAMLVNTHANADHCFGTQLVADPDLILSLDVDTIVPGHGPITDKQAVSEIKGYFEYIFDEARKRYETGMPAFEAAKDIPLDRYASWTDGERIVVNVAAIYRELSGDTTHPNVASLFGQMALFLSPGGQS